MYKSNEWWGNHDHEYIHYFYKIVNTVNNKYYYGIHSIRKTDRKAKNLEKDGYWGSGVDLEADRKVYGTSAFTKVIEKIFSTRKEVLEYESRIVTKDMISDPQCYNRVCGGGGNPLSIGLVPVTVKSTGKSILISQEEYLRDRNLYRTPMEGKVAVRTSDGSNTIITTEEYKNNQDRYTLASGTGYGLYKNKDNWEDTRWLKTDDKMVVSGQYIPIMKGIKQSEEVISKKTGENNGMYGKMWITNGKNNTTIDLGATIPLGWKRGRSINSPTTNPTEDKKKYINHLTGEIRFYHPEADIDYGFYPSFLYDSNGKLITFERLDSVHQLCKDWSLVKSIDPAFPSSGTITQIIKYYRKYGKSLTKIQKVTETRIGMKYSKEKEFYFITNGHERMLVTKKEYKDSFSDWKVLGIDDITVEEYRYIKSIVKTKKLVRKILSTTYDKLDEFIKKAGI